MTRGWLLACVVTSVLCAQEPGSNVVELCTHRFYREVVEQYERHTAPLPDSILTCVAKSYFNLGNNIAALNLYRLLDKRGYSSPFYLLDYALALTEVGSYDSASAILARALPVAFESGDTVLAARLTNVRGIAKMRQSQYPAALADFRKAELLAGHNPTLRSFIRTNQGIVFRRIGHFRAALRCYRESFRLDSIAGHLDDMASGWLNMGNVYYDLGQFDDAEFHFIKAHEAYTTVGDSAGAMLAVGNLAAVYQQTGRYQRARPLLEMAATYARYQRDRLLYLSLLQELAFGDIQLSRWEEADRLLDTLWTEALELNSVLDQFTILMLRVSINKHQRRLSDAVERLNRAGELCRSNDMEMEWMVLSEQASILEMLNRPAEAETSYRKAIRQLENIREVHFPSAILSSFVGGNRREPYRRLTDLLIRQKRHDDAYRVMESYRGRSFQKRKQDPSSSVIRLSYFVSDSAVYAFIEHDSVDVIRLGRSDAIRREVLLHSSSIRNRHADEVLLSDGLFNILVAPLLPWIPEDRPVAIVPDDFLHGLVFESLHDGKRYWIERNPIVYAPAAFLADIEARPLHPTADTVHFLCHSIYENEGADSLENLPYLENEKRHIRRTWVSEGGDDSWITESRVKYIIENAGGLLHIGAHGIAADRQQTALVFAGSDQDDGLLHVDEVRRLHVRAEFVALSACATSAGVLSGADGVSNLPTAFLEAGGRQVLSSSWAINDEAAAEFMGAFYKFLSLHQSVPHALRSTKLEFLKHPRYRIPYYWSGMVLWVAK